MGILNEVEQRAKELEELKQKTIKTLLKECKKYKDNRIKYISKKPRIFMIKFSDLKDNWTPEFYDYEVQFKIIAYVLLHTEPNNLINKWNTIKVKGIAQFLPSIVLEYGMDNPYADITKNLEQDWYDTNYKVITFHPDVVKFLDNLLLG